jgi:putative transposase
VLRTPIRAPNANAFAERWVETLRAECLDWLLIFGSRHLDRVLRIYVQHYNRRRPHRGLALQVPEGLAPIEAADCMPDIERRDLLGGLVHEDLRAADRVSVPDGYWCARRLSSRRVPTLD